MEAMTKKVPPVGDKTGPVKEARAFVDQRTEQQDGTKAGEAVLRERGVSVTAPGRMPPRLSQGVKISTVRKFLRDYREYEQELAISNCDGGGRVASPMREVVAPYIQNMIYAKFCKGEPKVTEALLRAGLAKFAGDDEAPDERVFAKDMPFLLRLNGRLPVEDRVSDVEGKIWQYLDENSLMDMVMPNGDWAVGPGEIVVSALLAGLWPPEYKENVTRMARMRGISSDPPAILEIMEKLGKEQAIVERRAARWKVEAGRGKAATVTQKAGKGDRATQKVAKQEKGFRGKCYKCGKVGHKKSECRSGGGGQTTNQEQTVDTSSQGFTSSRQRSGGEKTTGPTLNKGTTVAQRTISQSGPLSGGWGGTIANKAIFTAGEQEEFVMVQVPKRLFVDGGLRRNESVVEAMVSQQAGPSMPPSQQQTVPVKMSPEPSDPSSSSMSTRCPQLLVAVSERTDIVSTIGGGDKIHVEYLDRHLRGRLELPGADVGTMNIDIVLGSGAGVTALSKDVLHRLQQQWPGRELSRPYTGVLEAQVADGRKLDLTEQTVPLHLILASSWGDVRITLPFMIVPGRSGVVILGGLTLRKKLGIDVMQQLKATVERLQGGNMAHGPTQERGDVTEQA